MKTLNLNFPKLYDAQLQVAKACLKSDKKYIIVNGSRQVGKTFLLSIIAIYWALELQSQHIMIVSPTDSQVKKIYQQMVEMLEPVHKFIKNKKMSAGDSEIRFTNKSVILFRSAASEDTLRGYSNTHILLDECAFIKEETWQTILAPTLSVRGKKVLFCSTPKGKNFFSQLYSKGITGEPGYKSFKITYHQNPYANLEFINSQMQTLPNDIFAQEYLGEFTDQTGVFKDVDSQSKLIKLQNPIAGQTYLVGVDIAFKKDYTVAVCFNKSGQMVDYIRFNQTTTSEMQDKLINFFKKWKPSKIVIEENNQGLPVIDGLKQKGITNIINFQTNQKTKNELINQFFSAFNNKEISLLNEEIIKEEFKAFSYHLTPSGNIQFKASYGHDDIVMASAFAFKGIIDSKISQVIWM